MQVNEALSSGASQRSATLQAAPLRILFVAPYVPSRIRVRPYHLLRGLAERGHRLTLICPVQQASDRRDLELLSNLCEQIITVPASTAGQAANYLWALPASIPLQSAHQLSAPFLAAVRSALQRRPYDLIHLEHLRSAELGRRALDSGAEGLPLILDAVDSISLLFERALRASPSILTRSLALLDLARTRRYEAAYQSRFQQVVVTSPEDRWAIETLRLNYMLPGEHPIAVVPNGVDLDYFALQDERRAPATLVFTGKMSYHANHAAAMFLVRRVMPLVWHDRPEVQVQIIGAGPATSLRALSADRRVTVSGYVPDLRPYLARATIAVCPIRYGVGIQNKVLEAMAMGTAVITTRQCTVALSARPGEELLLAEDAPTFAATILGLLGDADRRLRLGENGRHYVETEHAWDRSVGLLERCYAAAMTTGLAH